MNWNIGDKVTTQLGSCTVSSIENGQAVLTAPDGTNISMPYSPTIEREPRFGGKRVHIRKVKAIKPPKPPKVKKEKAAKPVEQEKVVTPEEQISAQDKIIEEAKAKLTVLQGGKKD